MNKEQQQLIIENISYADKLAYSKLNKNVTMDFNLLQEAAYFGLIKAVLTFKDDRGTRFESYAFRRINGEMDEYIRVENRYHQRHREIGQWHTSKEEGDCADLLDTMIKGLPALVKKVFRLRYLDSLSKDQIGKKLNISESTVETLLSRYKKDLQRG